MFLLACVITVFPVWNIGYQYPGAAHLFLSSVPPVPGQLPDLLSGNAFHLPEGFFNGMPVIFIPERLGTQYDTGN